MEKKGGNFIRWFSELKNKDVDIAGGKGATLGEMYNLKLPVPQGFALTAQAYTYFIEKEGLNKQINDILKSTNINDTKTLNMASKRIRDLIENAPFPKELEDELLEAYEILGAHNPKKTVEGKELDALEILNSEQPFVAVRSSAAMEDLADASFAGQQDTYLNVKGEKDLLEKVKQCMASLFTTRAIYYREKKGFEHKNAYLSVIIQKMVNSEKSGVIFSQNPTKGEKTIVIEAVFGLGEGIVSGKIKPDNYVVSSDLDNFNIVEENIAVKKTAIIRNKKGENETITLDKQRDNEKVLTNYEIKRLAQYAKQLEEHYGKPQDIEFAIDDEIHIVQSRPITVLYKEGKSEEVLGNVLLRGLAASPGIASGKVRIVRDLSELEKVKEGDVLVAEMTNPDMAVSMEKVAAIVTDEGGLTSHAAIISREMGIPAVVGTGEATKKLKEGEEVTVDGNTGKIVEGKQKAGLVEILPIVKTKTKIKVIADLPEGAYRAEKTKCSSIGLTRLEEIIALGGKHPIGFVKQNKLADYTELIYSNLRKMTSSYEEMWVRFSDLRSDEYKNLEGAPQNNEKNPMMGDHGIRFSLKNKDIMRAEIKAIKKVATEFPNKIIGIMVPMVISVDELKMAKKIIEEIGMPKNIKIGIMVETPAAVQIIEDLCEEGIDFISFGTNDLTQFTLALDRKNEYVQDLYHETNPAVIRSIQQVIRVCKRYGVETSICGQAGSRSEMVSILVKEGIDSLSVNADSARKISEVVLEIENSLALVSKTDSEDSDKETEKMTPIEEVLENQPLYRGEPEDKDMEEEILGELNNEYSPNVEEKNKDIPSLNDSISVDSETFEEDNK